MNECDLSIIRRCGERSVRVVAPESLLMKDNTFLRTEDRDHKGHTQCVQGRIRGDRSPRFASSENLLDS